MSNQIRDLLKKKLSQLTNAALRDTGEVTIKKLAELGRLARLVEIVDSFQSPPVRRRWLLIAALVGTLLIVSILLFVRISEAEIELDMKLSGVSFELTRQQVLTDAVNLSALGISGLQNIRVPRSEGKASKSVGRNEERVAISLTNISGDERLNGMITLPALILPTGTRIWLNHTNVPKQYRLSLKGNDLNFQANMRGEIDIGLSNAPIDKFNFLIPRSIKLRPYPDEVVDLDMTFPEATSNMLSTQINVSHLSFIRIEQFTDGKGNVFPQYVSTILSGMLYMESLKGREWRIRPGETIRFSQILGFIRYLQLFDDHISLQFSGHVRGMSTGTMNNQRSLMPTCLEWLKAHHSLALLWGTTLYIFGLIVSFLSFWKVV